MEASSSPTGIARYDAMLKELRSSMKRKKCAKYVTKEDSALETSGSKRETFEFIVGNYFGNVPRMRYSQIRKLMEQLN